MTALSNTRINTVTNDFDWRSMDYEIHTCAVFAEVSGQFGIKLQDHPHNIYLGRKRISGLVISSITNPAGSTFRYNFSGSPDLSSVVVGDSIHIANCTTAANNGRFVVAAVSNASDYIEVSNATGATQGGAVGDAAVSYDEHDSVLDDPSIGQFNADTRKGTGRVVLNSAESTNIFIVQYEGGGSASRLDTIQDLINTGVVYPPGHLFGFTLSNGSDAINDIDVTAGSARDSTNTINIDGGAMTKRLDAAWAVGSGSGGLFSGSIANTTYHFFVIVKDSDSSVDYGFDTSVIAANRPAGYSYYRRIGSLKRVGGSIWGFIQTGDSFQLKTPVRDVNASASATALTPTMSVPAGIKVMAFGKAITTRDTGDQGTLISDPDVTDNAPSVSASPGVDVFSDAALIAYRSAGNWMCYTNTSAQIRYRNLSTDASASIVIITHGWYDSRGRQA